MANEKKKDKPEVLGTMTSYLNLASSCIPTDRGVKRLWFKGLAYLKEAISVQKKSKVDKLLNREISIEIIPKLHKELEEKYGRPIQFRLIAQLCKNGDTVEEIDKAIKLAVETFDGKISCLVPKCAKI